MFFVSTTLVFLLQLVIPGILGLSSYQTRQVTENSKAGLPWSNGNSLNIEQYRTTGKVSWYYTWSPTPITTNLEFVPMFWGTQSIPQFTSTINETIASRNVKAVLGMNEPEQSGQSNLSPAQAASLWQQYLEPLRAQGIRLGSPAPFSGLPTGKSWLQSFFTICGGGCTVDFIALHYYGTDATQFIQHLSDYHNTFQRPLWVTEWACQDFNSGDQQGCSQNEVISFLNTTQAFMDNSGFVERYGWFGASQSVAQFNPAIALMDTGGIINSLGKQYIGAAPAP